MLGIKDKLFLYIVFQQYSKLLYFKVSNNSGNWENISNFILQNQLLESRNLGQRRMIFNSTQHEVSIGSPNK
jgi:hypothetical protein